MASPQPANNQIPERRDYRKEVTESIIQMLQQGVAPWQKPWDAATVGNLTVPFNPTSNNPYRGGNAIYLMASAIRKGYDDPRWMTYKQAAANDWQIRGGEKGTQIEFWEKRAEDKDGKTLAAGDGSDREDTLRDHFEVGVFNLNYDTAAISAMPSASTGFGEAGLFDARAVHSRADWNFVYHLHGSVHHSLVRPNVKEIGWRADLKGEFFDTDEAVWPDMRSERRLFPVTTLLAGGFKLDQLLAEPFQSLHAALIRRIYEADAILIGGYGFGDAHVNHVLKNRLAAGGDRPPVLILDRRAKGAISVANDPWATELCNTLRTDGFFFKEVEEYVPGPTSANFGGGSFEVADVHRVALWNGGFAEASRRVAGIVPWLLGEPLML